VAGNEGGNDVIGAIRVSLKDLIKGDVSEWF